MITMLILKVGLMICCWMHVGLCSPECEPDLNQCDWGAWTRWSSCSLTCGIGTKTRTRRICCVLENDLCLERCHVTRNTFINQSMEITACISPCENKCTFRKYKNSAVNITDFMELYENNSDKNTTIRINNNSRSSDLNIYFNNRKNKLVNSPVLIHCSIQYCRNTCAHSGFHNGLPCRGYGFIPIDKCFLYFYTKPLSVTQPQLKGANEGQSLFLRECHGEIHATPSFSKITPSSNIDMSTSVQPTQSSVGELHQLHHSYFILILILLLI